MMCNKVHVAMQSRKKEVLEQEGKNKQGVWEAKATDHRRSHVGRNIRPARERKTRVGASAS